MDRFYFKKIMTAPLIPKIDYYLNPAGNLVFTEKYHLDRGFCCQSGCLHCPFQNKNDPNIPAEFTSSWSSEESAKCEFDEEE